MRPAHILLMFVPAALSVYFIPPALGDDPLTEFTLTFEWADKPTLALSKVQGDTYRISLEVDSLPSKRLPALLAELHEHHAPTVAVVRMTQCDEDGDTAQCTITFEPIHSGQVGATLKILIDLFDLKEITMDANVFEGKRIHELLDLLRAHKSTERSNDLAYRELVSAIESSLPNTQPHGSGWIVEIEGHHYEEVK